MKLGAFECHCQPKVRLVDRHWIGAEALIRWRVGDLWISPRRFIAIAEESGLIKDLGRWVLWEAASRNANWRREGLGGPTSEERRGGKEGVCTCRSRWSRDH